MIAIAAVVHHIANRVDAEGNGTAAEPAAAANATQAGEPLHLGSFALGLGVATVLAHRAVHMLGMILVFELLDRLQVVLGRRKLGCRHNHGDRLLHLVVRHGRVHRLLGEAVSSLVVLAVCLIFSVHYQDYYYNQLQSFNFKALID